MIPLTARHCRGSTRAAALLLLTLGGYCTLADAQVPAQGPAHAQASPAPIHSAAARTTPVNGGTTNGSPAASDDIRDIRGPKPLDAGWLARIAVAAALLAAGGAYATWVWNKRRRRAYVPTPFEIARDRLERARELMHQARGRDFSIEVSSTVREYIENRFRVMAAHRTTDEFLHDLLQSTDAVLAAHRTLLAEFLEACDLAKFGGWQLSQPNMEALLQSAHRFVVESAPRQAVKSGPDTQDPATVQNTYDSLRTT